MVGHHREAEEEKRYNGERSMGGCGQREPKRKRLSGRGGGGFGLEGGKRGALKPES